MMCAKGNALFLILIAVALFAALSYAVTQSGRGGGTIDRETLLLSTSQVMNFTTQVQTAVNRMILLGTPIDQVELCGPADTDGECYLSGTGDDAPCTTGDNCLFAPEGGNIILELLPDNIVEPGRNGIWNLAETSSGVYVDGMGTTAADLVVRTKSISLDGCEQINEKLGLSNPPAQDAIGGPLGAAAYSGESLQCALWWNGSKWLQGFIITPAYQ